MPEKNWLWIVLATILLVFPVFTQPASASTLGIKLTVPDNTRLVYVPGTGEVSPTADRTWYSPAHWYITSHKDNIVYSLVHNYKSAVSMGLSHTSTNHTLTLRQNLTNSHAFVVFTWGSWQKIENRMSLIEAGTFLEEIAPAFGYGLGFIYPLKIVLEYTTFDLENDLILQKGNHRLMFTHDRKENNKPVVQPSKVA